MKSLLIRSITRLANELHLGLEGKVTIQKLIDVVEKNYGGSVKWKDLVRLPDSQLRNMLKVPCPIGKINEHDIQLFKRLRMTYAIDEPNTCKRCPKAESCPFRDLEPKEKVKTKLQDIIYFLIKFASRNEEYFSILRWASAYKVSESLRLLIKDKQNLKTQALIFRKTNQEDQAPKAPTPSREIYKNRRFHLAKPSGQ